MDTSVLIPLALPGAALLACVVIPGLLVMWDRIPDPMEAGGEEKKT